MVLPSETMGKNEDKKKKKLILVLILQQGISFNYDGLEGIIRPMVLSHVESIKAFGICLSSISQTGQCISLTTAIAVF